MKVYLLKVQSGSQIRPKMLVSSYKKNPPLTSLDRQMASVPMCHLDLPSLSLIKSLIYIWFRTWKNPLMLHIQPEGYL